VRQVHEGCCEDRLEMEGEVIDREDVQRVAEWTLSFNPSTHEGDFVNESAERLLAGLDAPTDYDSFRDASPENADLLLAAERQLDESEEAAASNSWRYFHNGAWEALPGVRRACDLSLYPEEPYVASGLYIPPGEWEPRHEGSRMTATNDFEVYAWRYHEAIEPAPVPKDGAP
jgi:hypothetical protein